MRKFLKDVLWFINHRPNAGVWWLPIILFGAWTLLWFMWGTTPQPWPELP